jgi:hypothetical protein
MVDGWRVEAAVGARTGHSTDAKIMLFARSRYGLNHLVDFAGNAYPALTRTPFSEEVRPANESFSSVISIWWAHKDSNLGPAD